MIVETTRFGALEVDPCAVIYMPEGLIGFPESRRFVLFEHAPGMPFQWLQSVDDPSLAFIVVNPYVFFADYEVEIPDADAEMLGIGRPEDAQLLTTVTIRRSPDEITTNLLGPLVLGVRSLRAAQLVLDGDRYSTRHPLPAMRQFEPQRALQAAV